MKNITTGHWIFAAIFAIGFIGVLVWAYGRDIKITKLHYNRSALFLLAIIVTLFLLFIFRKYLQ